MILEQLAGTDEPLDPMSDARPNWPGRSKPQRRPVRRTWLTPDSPKSTWGTSASAHKIPIPGNSETQPGLI